MDYIITGASRGIGRALVQALASDPATGVERMFVLARDGEGLRQLRDSVARRCEIVVLATDLSRLREASAAGRRLVEQVRPGAVLIHNAGIWPTRCERSDGIEAAFVVNGLAPLALQQPLLQAGRLARVLLVSAGLIAKGRFDADKTPTGADFSRFRTYCSTKLVSAAALRDVARRLPQVDFAAIHPGVVNTDLGAAAGWLGWLLRRVKRSWESPEVCAARLLRVLSHARWSSRPGEAAWYFEERPQPWPAAVERDADAVRRAVARYLPDCQLSI